MILESKALALGRCDLESKALALGVCQDKSWTPIINFPYPIVRAIIGFSLQ